MSASQAALASDPDQRSLGALVETLTARQQAGEAIDLEAVVRAHPTHAEALRRLVPALQLLADLGGSLAGGGDVPAGEAAGTLGDYRIVREVGRGGMGIVYEAEQMSLGRRVALKVLPFAATMDPRQLQRFRNEGRAAASLEHPHIVPVYGVGCERGVHYIAMKFIDGRTLAALLDEQRTATPGPVAAEPTTAPAAQPAVDPEKATVVQATATTEPMPRDSAYFRRVAEWGVQAAEALEHAHSLGIVHRDIKPANLLVDGQGKLWVTDFGLAHCQSQAGLTMTGDVVGTLRYMSPEQALARHVLVDHRTDVYSLGVTLYELLTLEPAFGGRDREELLRQIASEEPLKPRRRNKSIPAELETIVLKALEKNPTDRYDTAQGLAEDLERFLKDEPIRARRPSLVQRARKWARRHQPVVWSAAAALLAIVAVIAGSIGWLAGDRAARRTETERAVTLVLDETATWQQAGRIPEALAAARRADWLAETGGAGEALRQRVRARRADLELVAGLEDARLQGAAVKDDHFDHGLVDRLYAEAFQKAELDVEAMPAEEAAERIRESSVAVELAAMLDHWAIARGANQGRADRSWKHQGRADPSWKHLLRVARAADPDRWRGRLRDALEGKDLQALRDLAGSEEVLKQSPLTLFILGEILQAAGAVQLLATVQY
jgi:serine/threonine protein kinase